MGGKEGTAGTAVWAEAGIEQAVRILLAWASKCSLLRRAGWGVRFVMILCTLPRNASSLFKLELLSEWYKAV